MIALFENKFSTKSIFIVFQKEIIIVINPLKKELNNITEYC